MTASTPSSSSADAPPSSSPLSTPSKHRASVTLEVPFHDVDSLNIVWHGHYLKYLEIARTQLFRDLGLTSGRVSDTLEYVLVVIESKLRHSAPLRFADKFRVDAWLKEIDYRICVAYEVHNLTTGRRALKAHTMLATLDPKGELLVETPRELLGFLEHR